MFCRYTLVDCQNACIRRQIAVTCRCIDNRIATAEQLDLEDNSGGRSLQLVRIVSTQTVADLRQKASSATDLEVLRSFKQHNARCMPREGCISCRRGPYYGLIDFYQLVHSVKSTDCYVSAGLLCFYRATRMHSADYAVARCLCVCSSVCPSVKCWYCIETA